MHGYYLCDFNPYDAGRLQTGVDRKVISQIDSFNRAGLDCSFIQAKHPDSFLVRGVGTLPGIPDLLDWPRPGVLSGSSYLYIRRPLFASRQFVSFLRSYKKENPSAVVILELPTYPYDEELNNPILYLALKKDRKYRKQYIDCVDYIADLNGFDSIFGVPVIPIKNGIDLDRVPIRKPSCRDSDRINIVQAASFAPWHGTDLIIRGLSDYYHSGGKRDVRLHLAGDGPELPKLKSLVEQLGLSEHVVFYGMLPLEELYALYSRCTLALGCFGLFRRDPNTPDGSLKTREYLAVGLPFVYAGIVDVLRDSPADFCLQFDQGENAVDFHSILAFYDWLYSQRSEDELISYIRDYAERNVSVDKGMENVISVLSGIS